MATRSTSVWKLACAADPRTLSGPDAIVEAWAQPLHFGTIGGWPMMALYVLATLAPGLLLVTGVMLWWRRHRRRQNNAALVAQHS